MNNKFKLIAILMMFIVISSCESIVECEIGKVPVECDESEIYNEFLKKERAINKTFEKFEKRLTLEENLALREDVVQYYQDNRNVLASVFEKVKDSIFGSRSPASIFEMRNEEINHFIGQINDRKEAKVFMESLNISEYETDTSFFEGDELSQVWVMKIHNISDSIISGILVDKIYEINGELIRPESPTHYLFSNEMISPTPIGNAVVRPNDTLILTFDYAKERIPKPEILGFFFK